MENEEGKLIPPEPLKDENGCPLPPPDGKKPPMGERPEPPKDENGRPLPPPDHKEDPEKAE